jgi:hypothetical protein
MKRGGGKPKGRKDTSTARMVAGSVGPNDARAELEFLRALNAHLPGKAFDELSQIVPDMVSDWTIQWHIHCPCVLEAARSLASLAQTWRDDAGGDILENLRSLLRNFGESYRGEPVPDIWLKELGRLYRLPPVEPIARLVIALEQELDQQDLTLRESDSALKRLERLLHKTPAQIIQETKEDSRRARARALKRVEVLAPPLTDGMESVQEYLPFALTYWAAMRARFLETLQPAGIPIYVVRPRPNLARDAQWLVRSQVQHASGRPRQGMERAHAAGADERHR